MNMNEQEIYQKIGELLWSIMPQEAEIITFVGKIYPEYQGWGTSFILKDGSLSTFDFGEEPADIELRIRDLVNVLRDSDVFKEKWTHYKITLTDALIYPRIEGEAFTDTPAEGKEYLVFFFNVENIDDENNFVSIHNFTGYVDDTLVASKILINNVDNVQYLSADLTPGKKARGYVAYEVDTNWKQFDIHYKENSFDYNDSMIFTVVNEEKNQNNNNA